MKRYAKWILAAAVAVVVLTLAAVAAIPYVVDTPRVQALIAGAATQALGRPVRFKSVSVTVFPRPAVELHDLTVADDPNFGTEPFLTLETGRLHLRLRSLLAGRAEFTDLVLERPLITVIQDGRGRWNIASLGPTHEARAPGRPPRAGGSPPGAGVLFGSRVKIQRGVMTYLARGGAETGATRYRVEDLDLVLTGGSPQLAFQGNAKVKPGDLTVKIADGVVSPEAGRTLLEAPIRARVSLEGKDLSSLVAASAPPGAPSVAGSIKGTLAVGGTLGAPTAAGDVEVSGAGVSQTQPNCPEPKRRTLALAPIKLNAAWRDGRLAARPLSTGIGSGTITTNLTATLDRGVRVQLSDLILRSVPIEKVLVDYLCQGYAVSGPLDLTGALAFEAGHLPATLSGPGQLRIGPGKVVGAQAIALVGNVARLGGALSSVLGKDLPESTFTAPLEFDSITGTYQITNGVVTTKDLLYTSRTLKVSAAGEYGLPTGRLDVDVVLDHGRGTARAKITGTAASPSIRVDAGSILRDVDPSKVERGLRDLLRRFR